MKDLLQVWFVHLAALLLFAGSLVDSQTLKAASSALSSYAECLESPREARLVAIAPMAGTRPVWMVDGAYGVWQGSDKPVKTAWVASRSHQGDLLVTGRRLDGTGRALFKKGVNSPIMEEFIIPNAHKGGISPGGASSEITQEYAFHPSYVIYPSPGCWEFVAHIGNDEVKIIINLRDTGRSIR